MHIVILVKASSLQAWGVRHSRIISTSLRNFMKCSAVTYPRKNPCLWQSMISKFSIKYRLRKLINVTLQNFFLISYRMYRTRRREPTKQYQNNQTYYQTMRKRSLEKLCRACCSKSGACYRRLR
jgi:hypothetical protein